MLNQIFQKEIYLYTFTSGTFIRYVTRSMKLSKSKKNVKIVFTFFFLLSFRFKFNGSCSHSSLFISCSITFNLGIDVSKLRVAREIQTLATTVKRVLTTMVSDSVDAWCEWQSANVDALT